MTVADKIGQLNIPVCLPQELLGDSTDPTGTVANREAYVRGRTVVGTGAGQLRLGPGGGFFGLVNQTLSGSVEVPHPLTPREQAEQHNRLQRLARDTRLGIPLLEISEGTHGSVGPGSTMFPEGPALGATFDPELIGQVYAAVAREARAVGIHALSTITAALVSQKALFQRRGRIVLHSDRLVLTDWSDTSPLVLTRADITAAETRFTDLYGRFLGGLLNAGKPLILSTAAPSPGDIYLLINRREFMETTDDRQWEKRINDWRTG
ncbi:glycoside hydrolase family 3 N-terminal domain-containing protein [Streptomyces hyaluromycini]|uniref:glycoside hydrolase family 3 N-terminal domain-containing protein n=1 Tax=Streptomyces hyaluromycini TaxID=1377993 RepID=UPI000B5CC005|nr:glycoside hydrolase family 3 N-terminal domain-containing protein [Streptomyces hyaluromycini]